MRRGLSAQRVARPAPQVLREIHALAPKSLGKIAAVEPGSGQFYLAETLLEATDKALKHHPGKVFYIVRVGYRTAHWHWGGMRLQKR